MHPVVRKTHARQSTPHVAGLKDAQGWDNSIPSTTEAMTTTTLMDLETRVAALALCHTATRTSNEAAGQEEKDTEKGKHASSAGCVGDDATGAPSSDEKYVEADPTTFFHRLRDGIKRSDLQLEPQTAATKKRQESNDASASNIKDMESEKAVLSSMFPTTACQHESKVWYGPYGNGSGHGLRCVACEIRVFRQTSGSISIKVPP
jgi:hypothetical protein